MADVKYASDYIVTWTNAKESLPKYNCPVVCFYNGSEFIGYAKDNVWFTKLGDFEAVVQVSHWKNIQD